MPDLECRFEYMRPDQIKLCRERADVAFLPLGSLEWHGVQNPVGTDGLKTHYICCKAARILGGGAVFPPLWLGLPWDSFNVTNHPDVIEKSAAAFGTEPARVKGLGLHGGMDMQEQWLHYQRLLRMAMEQAAGFGFRSIYLCAGHAPLIHWAKPVGITFARATSMAGRPVTVDWANESEPAGHGGDHGGKWETSLMMAAAPGSVALDEFARRPDYKGVGAGVNAVESTREQGEAWAVACAEAIAREAKWLVDNYPQLPPRHRHRR